MKEMRGDLFEPSTYTIMTPPTRGWIPANIQPNAIVITTNGFVKKNGDAVMGRGCAKRAAQLMPGLPALLGQDLVHFGTRVVQHGSYNSMEIVTFPVKPAHLICRHDKSNVVKHMRAQFKPGDTVPGWACVASLLLITQSAHELVSIANQRLWTSIILPRLGCGAGELEWKSVKYMLEPILDDRFYCITF